VAVAMSKGLACGVSGRAHRLLVIALLSAGIVAGALGLVSRSVGVLGWLEHRSVDARFALRGSIRPSTRLSTRELL
jgi:hypothetical protein